MAVNSSDRFSVFCFLMLGLLILLPHTVVMWIATEDILAGSTFSTPIIILSFSVLDIFSNLCSPFLVKRVSFTCSMVLQILLTVGSLLVIVLVHNVDVRVVGVATLGLSFGLGKIMCLRMATYYENADNLGGAFVLGTNIATFVASIGYTGLTTWVCVAPRTVTACCIPVAFSPLIIYALLDKQPLSRDHTPTTSKYQDIKYTTVREDSTGSDQSQVATKIIHEVVVLFKVFPFAAYYFLTIFCLQMSLIAVLSTLTFPTSPFRPRDHYQYYRLSSDAGIQLGGMELVLASCVSTKCLELFKIKRVWIFVGLNASLLILFLSASWYRFLPNVYVVLVMAFVQGICYGSATVQSMALASNYFQNQEDKGTAMGFLEASLSFGRLTAGLLGVWMEQYLKEHCTYNLLQGHFCLARVPSSNGWYDNVHCK